MPNRVVITGGKGFVGSYLEQELRRAWPDTDVVIWDLPEVDITDQATYIKQLEELQPAWVVHLAAIAAVGYAQEHPEQTHKVNVEGTRLLLQAIEKVSPQTKVLMISSADIYGGTPPSPIAELPLDQTDPKNVYATSKRDAELLIEENFNDRVIRMRPFPHIGPGQGKGFVAADFASQVADIEKGKQDPVMHVGNLESVRDFSDVRDVVRAYRFAMERGKVGEVYHVASGSGVKILDLLTQLRSLSTTPITVEVDEKRMRAADPSEIIGDASKARDELGWQPEISFTTSLVDILNWWRRV